ncbi:putative cytochrome P450 E-class, group IV [Triangularia setosa]|uniref:Cytochrome P450 monooxygenase ABA1 n=1 Tax=Triangularia setosa TaxID=2587417 RepID=A0AAN7AAW1_9PEZI|nr:putative cytochrome P450 E-class, group IV [Podospora setosa]
MTHPPVQMAGILSTTLNPFISHLVPALILLLFIIYYLLTSLYYHFLSPLRLFPGPPTTSFSYHWLYKAHLSGRMAAHFTSANSRYGSTIRVSPNDLITSDPEVIRRTSGARSKYTRSKWYKLSRLDPLDDAMFTTVDTKHHDELKAKLSAGYAGKDVPHLERDIDFKLRQVRELLEGKAKQGKNVDLARLTQHFTLDSISRIAFGHEADFEMVKTEGQDKHGFNYVELFEKLAPGAVTVQSVPMLRWLFGSDFVLKVFGPKTTDKGGMGAMMRLAKKLVGERFGEGAEDRKDMLGSFVRHGLTQRECETEVLIQIVAGSDTTATAIRATMLYVLTTPRVYHALQREIDDGIKNGKISNHITAAEGAGLPYLQGVIYEGLRLFPPFTGVPFKEVPPEGDTIDGKFVPGGTRIAASFWATGRHKGTFGEDTELFRPERWIEAAVKNEKKFVEMKRVAELVFGYGRWGCAGKAIAFLELNKIFVELLRHFDFQIVYPYEPWKGLNYNLWLHTDMWVSVTNRDRANQESKLI